MPTFDFPRSTLAGLIGPGGALSELTTPTLRLGVTGLARAGKTVFITALVRNLLREARLPFFTAAAQSRIVRAYLEPQPDHDVARFAYEEHLGALASQPPIWPESTRRISELRVTVEYQSQHPVWRHLGERRLHIDIVDYPGEWLIDLPLLSQSYGEWSAASLDRMKAPGRTVQAHDVLSFIEALDPDAPMDEQAMLKGADLFRLYLEAERSSGTFEPTLGPGRFLMPGDLAGSPLLTFLPVSPSQRAAPRGSLRDELGKRYRSYVQRVVEPFFRDHFARLDRQIVLVDALSAIDRGGAALHDLEATLAQVLSAFRTGDRGMLSFFLPRRIDRILFAATKADHVPRASHDRLEAILGGLTARAADKARFTGAEVRAIALAALRATQEAELKRGAAETALVGVPLPGEQIGGETFDGRRKAALYPGDLPRTLEEATRPVPAAATERDVVLVRFRPPRIGLDAPDGSPQPWPHIRLDRALEFLLGDRLE
ncbi:MAG: YcjX family protein [Hyphomicrobiaceae bacterium]